MAVVFATGWESRAPNLDKNSDGTPSFVPSGAQYVSTSHNRTGNAILECLPASGASGFDQITFQSGSYVHFGFYVTTMPTVERMVFGVTTGTNLNLRLTSTGALKLYEGTTLLGTSSVTLVTGQWYWIGIRTAAGTTVTALQVDDTVQVTATITGTTGAVASNVGCSGTEASAIDVFFDDWVEDSAGFLPLTTHVVFLRTGGDSADGTGWTLGTGTAISSNANVALFSIPPTGVADLTAGSDLKQIRNATANANSAVDINLQSYLAAGIGPMDTILAVIPTVITAAPVATSAKQATFGLVANPSDTLVSLSAAGTAGAFWSGTAAGTFPTGWKSTSGPAKVNPAVQLEVGPTVRINQVTSSTRIAMVTQIGAHVVFQSGPIPHLNPMPPMIAQ